MTVHRSERETNITLVIGALAFLLVIVGLIVNSIVSVTPYGGETVACTVDGKDRTRTDSGSDMRVYTDCGVFAVADNVFLLRFDSADTYAALTEGETYDFDAVGVRFPLLSLFPNILSATPSKG